jgi:ATP-dependent Clp protease ATP-binding subunit ClpA
MDFNKFTKNTQTAILDSKELLKSLDHAAIEPEHIMASVCLLEDIENSHFYKILEILKVDIHKLSDALRDYLKSKPKASPMMVAITVFVFCIFCPLCLLGYYVV